MKSKFHINKETWTSKIKTFMRHFTPVFLSLLCVLAISCKSGNRQAEGDRANHTADTTARADVIDRLKASRPHRLCKQRLTSAEAIEAEFTPDTSGAVIAERTQVRDAFFFPEEDIRESELADRVRLRCNFATVYNKVIQSYELFVRLSSCGWDGPGTKADTLAWIAGTQPGITHELLDEVLSGASEPIRTHLEALTDAYREFDGVWSDDCPLAQAFRNNDYDFDEYPQICSSADRKEYEEHFWEWYDKAQFVRGIDDIVRMNLPEKETGLTEEQLKHFHDAVVSEKNIDRRAVLALEYVKFDCAEGSVLLGEILESGKYTRYLFEVWLSWREHLQYWQSPSTYALIPNNYYDRMRVKCLNTLLRHYPEAKKRERLYTLCSMENFIQIGILHRLGDFGNESLGLVTALNRNLFIHPRISGDDYQSFL